MKLTRAAATAFMLSAMGIVSASAATYPEYIGQLAPTDSADRTIIIESGTRFVNVTQGEKVKFVANGREFVVDFNGVAQNLDLRQLAPEGTLDHKVETYVGVSPFMLAN